MKKILLISLGQWMVMLALQAQPVSFKGTVRCINRSANSTKGAESVIVVPGFVPSKSMLTGSAPPGYFELNTGVPFARLVDKQVSIYLISSCMNCRQSVKRAFITRPVITIADWRLDSACSYVELPRQMVDSLLLVAQRKEAINLDKVTSTTALLGSPALLNMLTTLVGVTAAVPVGQFAAERIGEGRMQLGQFLFSSSMYHTANTGFNFSPDRDMAEAVFWNPASIANHHVENNISLFTNLRNHGKLGGFKKINNRISLGGGVIFNRQDEYRNVVFRDANNSVRRDSFSIRLKEFAFFLSPSFAINKNFSAGLSVKSIHQSFNIPDSITFDANGTSIVTDKDVAKRKIDFDVSFSYKFEAGLQLGINVQNILGTELYSQVFVPRANTVTMQKQRSIGVGATYKWQRWNVGSDVLWNDDGFYDVGFGVNYVPFNNALVSVGATVKQLSYSAAFRLKHFKIAYVNDNDFLINERHKPRVKLFNGRLFSGFVFNL